MLLHRARAGGLPLLRDARILDTYVLAMVVHGKETKKTLQSLHTLYAGKQAGVAHRAMADVHANVVVLNGLLGDLGLQGAGGRGGARVLPGGWGDALGAAVLTRRGAPHGPMQTWS